MDDAKKLYDLKLGHIAILKNGWTEVMRVPGGWIFGANTEHSVFVPYDNEFNPTQPEYDTDGLF